MEILAYLCGVLTGAGIGVAIWSLAGGGRKPRRLSDGKIATNLDDARIEVERKARSRF